MSTRVVGLNRLVAAASAAVITAVGGWAFVSSTASTERDPFHFASVMHANAQVRVAQTPSRTVSTCPNNPEAQDQRAPACLRG
jgi:hypothetical protein